MKRWLLALVGLLCLSPGLALADYLVLVVNLGKARLPPPAGAGGAGMMGAAGMGGGGNQGGPRGGMRGGPMGPPGMGQRGGFGAQGGMGMQGGLPGGAAPAPDDIHLVPVCIEVDQLGSSQIHSAADLKLFEEAKKLPTVKHNWGSTLLIHDSGPVVLVQFYRDKDGKAFPRAAKRFTDEALRITRSSPTLQNKLDIAEGALSLGINKRFKGDMDTLARNEKTDPIVAAYLKIKEELDKPVDKMPADPWYRKLLKRGYEELHLPKSHYVLLHKGFSPKSPDMEKAKAKLQHLEDHLRDYYYWWAMRGLVLPVPREKLVAIVTADADEFKYVHKGLSGGPVVFDGFHCPGPNVIVMAQNPLEPNYTSLETIGRQYWTPVGKQPAQLLTSTHLMGGTDEQKQREGLEASMIALTLKAMEESSEYGSISHNASRQLLYASGLLPPHVVVPEWLLFGMSSIFETTPGIPWKNMGAANPIYLTRFRDLQNPSIGKTLELNGALALRQVVTDTYFRTALRHPPDSDEVKKARATAWALCYHLARKEPAKLQAYFKELGRMPRDLELDSDVLFGCFARAFDAWDSNRSLVNPVVLEKQARSWFGDMTAVPLDSKDLVQGVQHMIAEVKKALQKAAATGGGPMPPMP